MKKRLKQGLLGILLGLGALAVVSGSLQAGSLEPSGPPGPTMKTLDQIPPTRDQVLPAAQRFQLVMGGAAVLDKETGLVWEQSPATITHTWSIARSQCANQTTGGRKGWRLPSVHELASLVDPSVAFPGPTLPAGHPFSDIQSSVYWSATTFADAPTVAWVVFFGNGNVTTLNKSNTNFVWCVRGGMNADQY